MHISGPPGVQEWPRPHLAATYPPHAVPSRPRNPEMKMRSAGVAAVPNVAEELTSVHAHSRTYPRGNARQMRAVVAHPIVAHDGDVPTTPVLASVGRRRPAINPADLVHTTANRCHKPALPGSEDVSRRIVMMGVRIRRCAPADRKPVRMSRHRCQSRGRVLSDRGRNSGAKTGNEDDRKDRRPTKERTKTPNKQGWRHSPRMVFHLSPAEPRCTDEGSIVA